MGQGDEGDKPFKAVFRRFGTNVTYVTPGHNTFNTYRNNSRISFKNGCIYIDVMLIIECAMKRPNPPQTGKELYDIVMKVVLYYANLFYMRCVVVCFDCSKSGIIPKQYCYYSGPKRKMKPIKIKPKLTENGRLPGIVLDATRCPSADEWDGYRRIPEFNKQLNWFFADMFRREERIVSGCGGGDTWILFDNVIATEDLMDSYGNLHYHSARDTVYSTLCVRFNSNGTRHRKGVYHTDWCSCISEGELSMIYWIKAISRHIPEVTPDFIGLVSIDQDVIVNAVLRKPIDSNSPPVVVIMKKKEYTEQENITIGKLIDHRTLMTKKRIKFKRKRDLYIGGLKVIENMPSETREDRWKQKSAVIVNNEYKMQFDMYNHTQKKLNDAREKVVAFRDKNPKHRVTWYYNIDILLQNVASQYPDLDEPAYVIAFLLLSGGCDFFPKLFKGVNFKTWDRILENNPRKFQKLFQLVPVTVERNSFLPFSGGITLLPDPDTYELFVKEAYTQQNRACYRNTPEDQNHRWKRQLAMAWILYIIRYIPYLRWKEGVVPQFSPYGEDCPWGYEKGRVSGINRDVCKVHTL